MASRKRTPPHLLRNTQIQVMYNCHVLICFIQIILKLFRCSNHVEDSNEAHKGSLITSKICFGKLISSFHPQ